MTYPTQDQVQRADPLLYWIDREFLRRDPFAFAGARFDNYVALVAKEFDVDPNGIYCIGSGAIGLSLNPGKMIGTDLKPFSTSVDPAERSDLDIAIVSQVHFETAWRDLRKATQPTVISMDDDIQEYMGLQRKRLFDGAIVANKLLASLSFGSEWLSASVRLSEYVAKTLDREVDINYWIYRDYWSVRNYVSKGVVECRRRMT
jgi:hypothetical protein